MALPVFPSRVFRHGYIFVNARAGIRSPKDLEGKRVGVPLYTQTAALWARGHLSHQFGVDLDTIRWVQGAVEDAGTHGKPHAPPLLRPVKIEQNTSRDSLGVLLARGEIDALIGSRKPETFGRDPDVVRLFPNYRALERELYRNRQNFPDHASDRDPAVALRAPSLARHQLLQGVRGGQAPRAGAHALWRIARTMLPWLIAEIEEIDAVFGGDAFPYGVEPNRPTLEALVRYMVEQNFIARPIPIEDLFVPIQGDFGT